MRLMQTFLSVFLSVHFLENQKETAESAFFELAVDPIFVLDERRVFELARNDDHWQLERDKLGKLAHARRDFAVVLQHAGHSQVVLEQPRPSLFQLLDQLAHLECADSVLFDGW